MSGVWKVEVNKTEYIVDVNHGRFQGNWFDPGRRMSTVSTTEYSRVWKWEKTP